MQAQPYPYIVPVCEQEIEILYQDEYLLLINKPDLLLSIPGKLAENKDSVITRLKKIFPSASIVHRLDLDTSGIMIIPLSKPVHAHISKQFEQRLIDKTYTAVLFGHVENDKGIIDLPIAPDWQHRPLQKICQVKGRSSITHYEVLERMEEPYATRVLFKPVTGRSHQLRIHSKEIGHPILGCDLYATDEAFHMAKRLMLHATAISFEHPISHEHIHGYCKPAF
jgi:tRNA pseudouridine32 synthase / 23S rRNA pseudouridine746 synthase